MGAAEYARTPPTREAQPGRSNERPVFISAIDVIDFQHLSDAFHVLDRPHPPLSGTMTVVQPDRAPAANGEAEARPTTTTVHASWRGARRYEIGRPGGPAVSIDAAGETGLGPVDTMLGALAACSAIDVVDYLAKRRTPADRVDVRVDAERRAGIESAHAERAIALSFQTYCSVSASLARDLVIESRLVLNGVAGEVVVQRGEASS